MMCRYANILFFCLSLLAQASLAQRSVLDRVISIKITNNRLEDALKDIGKAGGFTFSYNPNQIELDRRISIDAQNRTVRQVLQEIFKGKVGFKESKGYVILQKQDPADETPKEVFINGIIYDEATGEKIAQASIFERQTFASAISDYRGYYKIKIPTRKASNKLEVRKENYLAKTVALNGRSNIDVALKPQVVEKPPIIASIPVTKDTLIAPKPVIKIDTLPTKVTLKPDTIIAQKEPKPTIKKQLTDLKRSFIDAFISAKQAIHDQNISDTLYRPFQLSFLPFLGTNHVLSGRVINTASINVVSGYSLGVEGIELGGVLNLVRRDVNGFQAAGSLNLVGRDVNGFQVAGFGNSVLRNQSGVQMAGAFNVVGKDVKGWQLAGAANVSFGNVNGWQLAPYNFAMKLERGHQLGVINYADSASSTPFGVLSFVRKNGYRRLEFSADELNYANISFKTGVHRLYNIFSVGFNFAMPNKPDLSMGYGLGTAFRLGKKWGLNIDATDNALFDFYDQNTTSSEHLRLATAIEIKFKKQMALSVGATFNGLWSADNQQVINPINGTFRVQPLSNGRVLQTWAGFQVALRICNLGS